MKVIVTGSRDFADRDLVRSILNELYHIHDGLIVVHGCCPTGADRFADDWALDRQHSSDYWMCNVTVTRYAADWTRGNGAGMVRNAEMVKAGADLVVAFFQPGAANKGTSGCVKLARRAGIGVREYGREVSS